MRWCLLLATFASVASFANAENRPPPILNDFMYVFDAVDLLKDPKRPLMGLRQGLSLVGRDDMIDDRVYDLDLRPACTPLLRAGKPVDPVSEIVRQAKATDRLLIMNEAHDDAQTRAFIASLLAPVRKSGFSIYAAETFLPSIGKRAPAWPLLSDGYYATEPTFGELIRQARSLEFDFVPYEMEEARTEGAEMFASIAAREVAQSRNIYDRILQPVPHAKAFVHVGHSHLNEEPIKWGDGPRMVEWMASRLKKLSGVDPLTVDQTTFQSPLDRPVVCALRNAKERERAAKADLTIALPAPVIVRGRPEWRREGGARDVAIPSSVRTPGNWTIVEAHYDGEPSDAVPADRVLIGPSEDLPLLLKPGSYRIEGWTRERGWTASVEVQVPAP